MSAEPSADRSAWSVFIVFLRLGLTSFGGPVAHIGYFREEFVARRRWLSEAAYGDLVGLCQFLPGPASSQVGIAIGQSRAGYGGAAAAWFGFTLPSALLMVAIAIGLNASSGFSFDPGVLRGLKAVAVAVVAQAVWGMGRSFCTDFPRLCIMVVSCLCMLLMSWAQTQLLIIAMAGLAGLLLLSAPGPTQRDELPVAVKPHAGGILLLLFCVLLALLPLTAAVAGADWLSISDSFYRAGALVFGGGHVVLPLLQAEVVPPGWIDNDSFLAGYGAAQAMPGPLFTFAAYLGAAMQFGPGGWTGGLLALVLIFLPAFLLVLGALPFWEILRSNLKARSALAGVNAGVVGLLLAALYDPVWISAILTPYDFLLATLALFALLRWQLAPWLVVVLSGTGGLLLNTLL